MGRGSENAVCALGVGELRGLVSPHPFISSLLFIEWWKLWTLTTPLAAPRRSGGNKCLGLLKG